MPDIAAVNGLERDAFVVLFGGVFEHAALMTPVTVELEKHYRDLKLPVVIIVGGDDQIADVDRQSKRLHNELPNSDLIVVPGMGHMIQHLAPTEVIAAIDRASELVREVA